MSTSSKPGPVRPTKRSAPARSRSRARTRRGRKASSSPTPILIGVAVVVVAMAVVALVVSSGSDDDGAEALPVPQPAANPVTVTGPQLPVLPDQGADPAAGRVVPSLGGRTLGNRPITIGPEDNRPYAIVFLAHWCPHCQREVPELVDWLEGGGRPDGVALYGVATGTNLERPNYPPSAWLEDEGWPLRTLNDDAVSSAARAFGLSAFPFFVLVNGDGTVAERFTGEVEPEALQARLETLTAGRAG